MAKLPFKKFEHLLRQPPPSSLPQELTEPDALESFLHYLFKYVANDHSKKELNLLHWLNYLLFAGDSPQEQLFQFKKKNVSYVCAYMFSQGEAAYQCRTCEVDPTCIQCMPCFQAADHTGHDYRMTQAGGGGCCDCGDVGSWDPKGVCSRHKVPEGGQTPKADPKEVFSDLVYSFLTRVINYVIQLLSNSLSERCGCYILPDKAAKSSMFMQTQKEFQSLERRKLEELEKDYKLFLFNDEAHDMNQVRVALCEALKIDEQSAESLMYRAHFNTHTLIACGIEDHCHNIGRQLYKEQEGVGPKLTTVIRPTTDTHMIITEMRFNCLVGWLAGLCREVSAIRTVVIEALTKPLSPEQMKPGLQLLDTEETRYLKQFWQPVTEEKIPNGYSAGEKPEDALLLMVKHLRERSPVPDDEGKIYFDILGPVTYQWIEPRLFKLEYTKDMHRHQAWFRYDLDCCEWFWTTYKPVSKPRMAFSLDHLPPKDPDLRDLPPLEVDNEMKDIDEDENTTPSEGASKPPKKGETESYVDTDEKTMEVCDVDEEKTPTDALDRLYESTVLDLWCNFDYSIGGNCRKNFSELIFQLLIDTSFKETFTIALLRHYSTLTKYQPHEHDAKNRFQTTMLSYSVQLFTIENLSMKLTREVDLLGIFFRTIYELLEPFICDGVVRCDIGDLKEAYFKLYAVSKDIEYTMRNKDVMRYIFIENPRVIKEWVALLSLFEGMDPHKRRRGAHVLFTSQSWRYAFNLEYKMFAISKFILEFARKEFHQFSDTWQELQNILVDQINAMASRAIDYKLQEQITDSWPSPKLSLVRFLADDSDISFHFPATRFCFELLNIVIAHQSEYDFSILNEQCPNILSEQDGTSIPLFRGAVERPLRLLAAVAQIRSELWVRNGSTPVNQVCNYIGKPRLMYNSDRLAVQMAMCGMDQEYFMGLFIYRFLLHDWFHALHVHPEKYSDRYGDNSKVMNLANKMLFLLISLLTDRVTIGQQSKKQVWRYALIQWLMIQALPFSSLLEVLGTTSESESIVREIVQEIATFNMPTAANKSGTFLLKKEFLKEFDPYFYGYTAPQLQEAEQNYDTMAKIATESKEDEPQTSIYPPNIKLPPLKPEFKNLSKILPTRICLRIWAFVLHNVLDLGCLSPGATVENIQAWESLYLHCLVLIGLAIQFCESGEFEEVDRNHFIENLILAVPSDSASIDMYLTESLLAKLCRCALEKKSPRLTWTLKRLKALDPRVNAVIVKFFPEKGKVSSTKMKSNFKRKKMMKKARKRALERIQRQCDSFMKANRQEMEESKTNKMEEGETFEADSHICIRCLSSDNEETMCLLAWVNSTGFEHDSIAYPPTSITIKRNETPVYHPQPSHSVQFCGHAMHKGCFDTYSSTIRDKYRRRQFYDGMDTIDVRLEQFVCPLCKSICNMAMTLIPATKVSVSPIQSKNADDLISKFLKCAETFPSYLQKEERFKETNRVTVGQFTSLMLNSQAVQNFTNKEDIPSALYDIVTSTVRSREIYYRCLKKEQLKKSVTRDLPHLSHFISSLYTFIHLDIAGFVYRRTESWGLFANLLSSSESKDSESSTPAIELINRDPFEILVQCLLSHKSLLMAIRTDVPKESGTDVQTLPFELRSVVFLLFIVDLISSIIHIRTGKSREAQHIYSSSQQRDSGSQRSSSDQTFPRAHSQYDEEKIDPMQVDVPEPSQSSSSVPAEAELTASSDLSTMFSAFGIFLDAEDSGKCCRLTERHIALLCLPYLRQALLLISTVANLPTLTDVDSAGSPEDEMNQILQYFGFPSFLDIFNSQYLPEMVMTCFSGLPSHQEIRLEQKLETKKSSPPPTPRSERLLESPDDDDDEIYFGDREHLSLVKPTLIHLPELYDEIFQKTHNMRCPNSHCKQKTPSKPAICLMCGRLLCASTKKKCCHTRGGRKSEIYNHTSVCGYGVGAILLVKTSMVFFITNGYPYKYGSPYLDNNGEQDEGLLRGRPLFLNSARWRKICDIVASGEISALVCRGRNSEDHCIARGGL